MKLSELRGAYYQHSGSASGVARQLAMAGIAVAWIFRTGDAEHVILQQPLRLAVFAFVIALAADFLQYFFAAAIWGTFHFSKEQGWRISHLFGRTVRRMLQPDEVVPHTWINFPSAILWAAKCLAVTWGGFELIAYLWRLISPST